MGIEETKYKIQNIKFHGRVVGEANSKFSRIC